VPDRDSLHPEQCAKLLAALATPERLKIVRFLSTGPHHVTDIAAMLGLPAVNVSHHLKVLEVSGLVEGTKRGRFVWYSLRPGVLERTPVEGDAADAINLGCCKILVPLETTVSVKTPAKRPRRAAGE
jgi:DNA-binding transcriptional ArsR family regulator